MSRIFELIEKYDLITSSILRDKASACFAMLPHPGNTVTIHSANEDQIFDKVDKLDNSEKLNTMTRTSSEFRHQIIWLNVISIGLLHIFTVIALPFTVYKMKILSFLWMIFYGGYAGFGVTGGAHRLWSHRAYKAKLPLRIILLSGFAAAGMNSLYDWVRDHRVHHKFSETDADPHNSKRGFFFSHVGWLFQKKHPEVARKGKLLDFSDIKEDPLLKFYEKYFIIFQVILSYIVPVLIPVYVWNETWFCAASSQLLLRYTFLLNITWSVNSFAHIWGKHPYDKRIQPAENISLAALAMGEGWHNYHHVFPWDYKAAELGNYKLNITTMWLDLFAKIGWAYDLKSASPDLVQRVLKKYGDGSYDDGEIPYTKLLKTK